MFNQNYLNYRHMMFHNTSQKLTAVDGTIYTMAPAYSYSGDLGYKMASGYVGATPSYQGTYFGSGTTPPALSDYKLESPIESGLSVTSSSLVTVDKGNGVYELSCAFILRNTNAEGGENITVSEIGYYGVGGVSSKNSYYCLMERQVLAVPVVLAPGERKLVTYKLTINQIFNVD